jgi:hypothetical protein
MRKDQQMEDFFQTMVKNAWEVAKKYFDAGKIQPEDFSDFEAETRNGFQPFIGAYDLCGSSTECADEVEGAPWLDYDDQIYHLILPNTFAEFIGQLSYFSFHSVRHLAKPGLEELVHEVIAGVFRRHLAEYTYFNPICGRADICNDSRAINPWKN